MGQLNLESHLDLDFTFLPNTFSAGSCCYIGIFSKASACSLVNKGQGSIELEIMKSIREIGLLVIVVTHFKLHLPLPPG